ncbi:tetratricopeptide repeat protein [Desulfogranum mediterraneum]|uniref:tetratricopeptide repeat protein n=1 Tax=Desulfogranum mediterraneum TaxID=160661 RepID=UPI0009FC9D62|nr:tetratricopeptide repeat protein [Desulfogranum mediterraneum]
MYPADQPTPFSRAAWSRTALFLLLLLALLQGCAQRSFQSTFHGLRYDIVGEHYLMLRDYEQGYAYFKEAVKTHPDNAEASYFTGRFLLASKRYKAALPYLKKAVILLPKEPDYHFWLGVAYGANRQRDKEKKSYQQALALDKKHLQALIYLGNNLLGSKQYQQALVLYAKALRIWPNSPAALYNRALAAHYLQRTPEERTAWLEYLRHYPSGGLARRAVAHLNGLGDFSYRLQQLGARSLSLPKITFTPLSATLDKASRPALDLVGATAANLDRGTLDLVVYQKNNAGLARRRALSIKRYLSRKFPELAGNRIRLSWFSSAERIRIKGRRLSIDESVRFILTPPKMQKK